MRYAATGIQGWRTFMEDAHVAVLDIGDGNSFFGVWDGHGGPEVAHYASKHMVNLLKDLPTYKEGNYVQALEDVHLMIDKQMKPLVSTDLL